MRAGERAKYLPQWTTLIALRKQRKARTGSGTSRRQDVMMPQRIILADQKAPNHKRADGSFGLPHCLAGTILLALTGSKHALLPRVGEVTMSLIWACILGLPSRHFCSSRNLCASCLEAARDLYSRTLCLCLPNSNNVVNSDCLGPIVTKPTPWQIIFKPFHKDLPT